MDQFDSIITGEAVAIDSRPASVMTRALATFLDFGFYLALAAIALMVTTDSLMELNAAQSQSVLIVGFATVLVVVPTAVEVATGGRSLGKVIVGTRVVRDDGGPISFRNALTRWSSGFIELILSFGLIAFTVASLNPRSKRLGDLMAGTYVVRVTGAEEIDPPILCPPELATWAATADMRALPSRVSLYARKYLARTATLTPQVRQQLGNQLAADVQQYVAPAPPPGTHPERFLAAVLATRRDREYALALGRQAQDRAEQQALGALPHGVRG